MPDDAKPFFSLRRVGPQRLLATVGGKLLPQAVCQTVGRRKSVQISARRLFRPRFAASVIVTGDPFRFHRDEQLAAGRDGTAQAHPD